MRSRFDLLFDVVRQPAVRSGTHQLVRKVARDPSPRERLYQLRQVLARFDGADVQDEALSEAIPFPHSPQLGRIVNDTERWSRSLMHDVHA